MLELRLLLRGFSFSLLVIFSDGECAASFVSPHLAGLLLRPIKDLIEAGQNGMKNKKLPFREKIPLSQVIRNKKMHHLIPPVPKPLFSAPTAVLRHHCPHSSAED